MDKSLRQTLGVFDLVHSSHQWVPTILLCGKHMTTVKAWIISRLWFCRRSRRLKINIKRISVHFRESHACANKLDVQETNFSFTQLHRSGNNFSWCRFTHGRYSRCHSLGFSDRNMSFRSEQDWTTQTRAPKKPVAGYQGKHAQHHPIQAHQRHSNEHWPTFHPTQCNLVLVPCCMSVRTMRR